MIRSCCLTLVFAAAAPAPPDPAPADFIVVSGPAAPHVAWSIARNDASLAVTVDVATFTPDGTGAAVTLGLSAARTVIREQDDAAAARAGGRARFTFTVPAANLVAEKADWKRLRMALAVRWAGGPAGRDRRRERLRHTDRAAPHAPLSRDPADWEPLDLAEYAAVVADRRDRIVLAVDQPRDGKLTVVVEDAGGRRVRNLVAGRRVAAGTRQIAWDGLDDEGRLVAAGAYRWRAVHHPGIEPEYLMSFCNGGETFLRPFGSNHGFFSRATTNGDLVFLAAPITEGGYAMIAVAPGGAWRQGYRQIHGTGIHDVAVAAGDRYFYAAHDGPAWGQRIDRTKNDWQAAVKITLTRYEIASAKPAAFGKGKQFTAVETYTWGPGAASDRCREDLSLTGMALVGDRLYVGSRNSAGILVLNAATAAATGTIELPDPGPLAADGAALYAVSGTAVARIDPGNGETKTVIPSGTVTPAGLAVSGGRLYVSDGRTHTVRIFDAAGKAAGSLGIPGGPYAGAYKPARMANPAGLAAAGGRLWVTERRTNPKRALAWDLAAGRPAAQKFGCPPYGGPGASFDPADHTRWIGLGATWTLDFGEKTARCRSVLQKEAGHIGGYYPWCINYRTVRRDGRVFLVGLGKAAFVSELTAAGTVRDLAFVSSCHHFSYGCHWKPPPSYIDAFNERFPDRKGDHAKKGPGVLWVDGDGDGRCDAEEFDFATTGEQFAGSGWGHLNHDLDLHVPVTRAGGRRGFAVLRPDGYLTSGAPHYPKLDAAVEDAVMFKEEVGGYDYKSIHCETAVDRFGNVVFNTDPQMVCYAPDGHLRWHYPNRWVGVHGSHKAPLPSTGELQGALFFLGMAALDEQADVFMMNGNHGRFFVMTTDGMYLDEMFKDVRMGGARDERFIGGEAFGGSFGRSEKDGAYYLQTGGDGYRVYRLRGLDRVTRSAGTLAVSPQQVMAAERRLARRTAAKAAVREAVVRRAEKPVTIDGRDREWPNETSLSWDRDGRFPVAVRAAYDEKHLYLCYDVRDESPWRNTGKDWTTLFKTGDSVDLQLGTDPSAPPGRRKPVPGDLRLLIAPFGEKPLAVLYRHRVPGAKDPVTFTCPWRSATVDVVRKLSAARVAVETRGGAYRVEAAVPLADLGIAGPAGTTCRADFGVIYGDRDGTINTLRSYWANPATMLVNDVPGEIMLHPDRWGTIRFERRAAQ